MGLGVDVSLLMKPVLLLSLSNLLIQLVAFKNESNYWGRRKEVFLPDLNGHDDTSGQNQNN
ncbi:hypothetical protein MJO28_017180 [Puccinia striiformis f. sp. tritici]|nr:hypothetical protein MJO28_017180 [Puccinia striiformis f. sp. tritici]